MKLIDPLMNSYPDSTKEKDFDNRTAVLVAVDETDFTEVVMTVVRFF